MSITLGNAMRVYKRSFIHIAGIALVAMMISSAVNSAVPIIGVAFTWLVNGVLAVFYLGEMTGKSRSFSDLINVGTSHFARLLGVGAIVFFLTLLWALIPIAGPFIAIYKSYCYVFSFQVAYTEPNLPLTECLKRSAALAYGRKKDIFLADLLIVGGVSLLAFAAVVVFILFMIFVPYLAALAALPIGGIIIAVSAVVTPFVGLYHAQFFVECESIDGIGILREETVYTYEDKAQDTSDGFEK